MKRCQFCGEKIEPSVSQCVHCGKTLTGKKTDSTDQAGLTNINTWEEKRVPPWVMYLVIGFLLFCIWAMFSQITKEKPPELPADAQSTQLPASDN
jgi:uncharacterized membrane protein YvbJ